MRRGDIWTIAGGTDYARKPRPAVIIQDGRFDATHSVTVCAFTTNATEAALFRPMINPDDTNGLLSPSRLMVDKITTLPRPKIGTRFGQLSDEDILRLNRALMVFLGLAGSAT